MDATNQLNMTEAEDSQVKSSNCGSTTETMSEERVLKLDDSTKLVGVQVVLILAYSTIILFGVIGNSLVIYVVYKFKTLRTWKFGRVLCFMLPCAQGMAVHVSTITLNIIALDRHRSIVYHTETKMSKDMCAVVIVITWAVSALLASPLAIFREYGTFDLSPDESIQVCAENWPESSMNGTIYSISMLLVQYGLPLAINSVRRKKTTKMLLTMVVVFAVSWLPFHAFQLAADIDSSVLSMKDFKLLFTVFHIVAMCSTFVNPILYGWMNNNYRSAFLSVCKCYWPFSLRPRCSNNRDTKKEEDRVCTDCKSTNDLSGITHVTFFFEYLVYSSF
uniref:Neuropeptide Y receptor Y2 n=1 Tax=Lates calcarifer TaxID=8187 RepID=A0A4W6EXH1_LATCA